VHGAGTVQHQTKVFYIVALTFAELPCRPSCLNRRYGIIYIRILDACRRLYVCRAVYCTLLISMSRYYSKKGVKKKVPVDSVLGVFFTPSF
jgi:hypothetical protein